MVTSKNSYCVLKSLPVTRQLMFCAQTSIEHVPTYLSGNYITLLFYPLSTILNYCC